MASERGRARSEFAKEAILASAIEILDAQGPSDLTIEAVAARAGVGKPTIYRHWGNAQELSMAALMAQTRNLRSPSDSKDILGQFRSLLEDVILSFASRSGQQAAALIASADSDSEISKAFRHQVILKSREHGSALLQSLLDSSQMSGPISIETLLDMVFGSIFYRITARRAPLDDRLADDLVAAVSTLLGIDPTTSERHR